jgi:hypothetical protein
LLVALHHAHERVSSTSLGRRKDATRVLVHHSPMSANGVASIVLQRPPLFHVSPLIIFAKIFAQNFF